jgi:hypothetical protein
MYWATDNLDVEALIQKDLIMTSLALGHPAAWTRIEVIWHCITRSLNRPTTPDNSLEDTHNRQEFILEMLNKNPEAFQSEQDVQSMMYSYPGRF